MTERLCMFEIKEKHLINVYFQYILKSFIEKKQNNNISVYNKKTIRYII